MKQKYVKFSLEGSNHPCYYHMSALDGLFEEIQLAGNGVVFKVEIVELTQEEFDALPEWSGW